MQTVVLQQQLLPMYPSEIQMRARLSSCLPSQLLYCFKLQRMPLAVLFCQTVPIASPPSLSLIFRQQSVEKVMFFRPSVFSPYYSYFSREQLIRGQLVVRSQKMQMFGFDSQNPKQLQTLPQKQLVRKEHKSKMWKFLPSVKQILPQPQESFSSIQKKLGYFSNISNFCKLLQEVSLGRSIPPLFFYLISKEESSNSSFLARSTSSSSSQSSPKSSVSSATVITAKALVSLDFSSGRRGDPKISSYSSAVKVQGSSQMFII